MKKNFTAIQKKEDQIKDRINTILLFILGFCLYIFVYMNILASQNTPSLYVPFVTEDRDAAIQTLHHLRFTDKYADVYSMQRNIYGNSFESEINKESEQRKQNIKVLEKVLDKNPKATDVLHQLSVFYKEIGEFQKSDEYLKRTQEIDPTIK